MESDKHLRKFFMDVYDNLDMYYEYLEGKAFLDPLKYSKWHSEQEHRNNLFAQCLKDNDRVNTDTFVLESALSGELSVSNFLGNNRLIMISDFDKFTLTKGQPGKVQMHYICNGYYSDTLEQIYQVLTCGSFSVGICTEKKTDLFREVKAHYRHLKDFLLKNGYVTEAIESNIGSKNRIYLLTYDYYNQRVKK